MLVFVVSFPTSHELIGSRIGFIVAATSTVLIEPRVEFESWMLHVTTTHDIYPQILKVCT